MLVVPPLNPQTLSYVSPEAFLGWVMNFRPVVSML